MSHGTHDNHIEGHIMNDELDIESQDDQENESENYSGISSKESDNAEKMFGGV